MKILVTGAAGFIGFHTAKALLERGYDVIGLDNLNSYYDINLKNARLNILKDNENFCFHKIDLADRDASEQMFKTEKPSRVIHLAAQPGVRYSLVNPHAYIEANIVGFLHILEGCRHNGIEHLVYASTSSVYGANENMPYGVHQNVDHPLSLYAASKKSNELMAHTYAHLYNMPVTGLRFFTVYGPWGRPDMAPFIFCKKILSGEPIDVFNNGHHARDFTYIDDIVEGIIRAQDRIAMPNPDWSGLEPDPATSCAPYRLYNIGNHEPVALMDFISYFEEALGMTAKKNFLPMQPGDVHETYADVTALKQELGFEPKTPIREGIEKFVQWYKSYYRYNKS
ncbi:MAG: NAD-dependent epimerase [Pseudomonadota bacterium]